MKPILSAACLIACATPVPSPSAADGKAPRETQSLQISIEELKQTYLGCEDAAAVGISSADAMLCSVVYETLKKHAFGGNYAKLRQWTETQKIMRSMPKPDTSP